MATELHDDVCNSLLALEMNIRTISGEESSDLSEQLGLLSNTRERLRTLSHELMPPAFQYATLDEMLGDYVLHLAQMMSFEEIDDALKFLTVNGATTLGLRDMYGLETGKPANFIVLDADSVFNAVYERCSVLRSVRAGRTLFTREETIDTGLALL